jgi:hypothetical protein
MTINAIKISTYEFRQKVKFDGYFFHFEIQ